MTIIIDYMTRKIESKLTLHPVNQLLLEYGQIKPVLVAPKMLDEYIFNEQDDYLNWSNIFFF